MSAAATTSIPSISHDSPNKLRDTFAAVPASAHASAWDALYRETFTPWDRAGPSLALADLLEQRTDLVPASYDRDSRGNPLHDPVTGAIHRRTALVPGCGPGHDVLLLSSLGYDAWGLDFSTEAIDIAAANERKAADEGQYQPRDNEIGKGRVSWTAGDFFHEEWANGAGTDGSGKFDLIFDYTFLCALSPELRPQWAKRMTQLLTPRGFLICLEYPSGKPLSERGPPWGLWPEVYEELLSAPGHTVEYNDDGTVVFRPCSKPSSDALHRICLVKPTRTHKAGTNDDGSVRDFISVWSR